MRTRDKNLTDFLKKMGVNITWTKQREIRIEGRKNLLAVNHKVMFDRIEAGTFVIAGALTGKKIKILGVETKIIKKELEILKKMGVQLTLKKNEIGVRSAKRIKAISINTEPYPGFPTDLQAQIMVLMTKAKGLQK